MNLKPEMYETLSSYSNKNPNEEVCGFIVEKESFIEFIAVDNKHPEKEKYVLVSPKDYLQIKNNYNILYYFHSHPDGFDFSSVDLFYQKYHNLNMIIYDVKQNMFKEKKCKLT